MRQGVKCGPKYEADGSSHRNFFRGREGFKCTSKFYDTEKTGTVILRVNTGFH